MSPCLKHVLACVLVAVGLLVAAGELTAQQKAAVPGEQAQQASQKAAGELYGGRFRQAKSTAEKTALATEIVDAALKVKDGSADQYVLLKIARDVAAGAGDAPIALRAVEKMVERFDVPGAKLTAETLQATARKASTSSQQKAVAEAVVGVVDAVADEGAYDLAIGLCELARTPAQKSKQYSLAKELTAKIEDLKKRQHASQEYQDALAVLEQNPTDPAANLAAGRQRCFVHGDWDRGLQMLSLGSDAELKAVAAKELAGAKSAEEQAALGDAWWALAEKLRGADRDTLRLRAGFWYRQAEPSLGGSLAGLKIKQRQEELAKLGLSNRLERLAESPQPVSPPSKPRIPSGLPVMERAGPLKERSSPRELVFQFNDKAFAEKYWEWIGEWSMTDEGGKAPSANSRLCTRHAYRGNVTVDMDFSFGQAAFTNTGGCWITMWGKQLTISMEWQGLQAKVHIHREGNEIVYVLNGKEQRIPVEPEVGAKPTTIAVYWRSRTSHFRRIEIKADAMVPVDMNSIKHPQF